MLALALIIATFTGTSARNFNITYFSVPAVVPSTLNEVEIECRYDANFTLLSWFKGRNEFFRYKPGSAPSTRSFPIIGVGKIDLIVCGPTACRLRLGELTEEASGLYRCDIERDTPPYQFESRKAHMEINGHEQRKPLLEGLAAEYGEDDVMQAYCRGAFDSEIRWYINAEEDEEARGSVALKKVVSRLMFLGVTPTVTVQCAEFRNGKLSGSSEVKARWRVSPKTNEIPEEQRNFASSVMVSNKYLLMSILCLLKL